MEERLKYVIRKKNKDGSYRYYWQRKGHAVRRLPIDPVERFTIATKLNQIADVGRTVGKQRIFAADVERGTIRWVIDQYRQTEKYGKLASGTRQYYDSYLDDILGLGSTLKFSAFTRRMVIDFVASYSQGNQKKVANVLRSLFNVALYHEIVPQNLATSLDLKAGKRRDQIWKPADIVLITKMVDTHPKLPYMKIAFSLLQYTAQRPGDMLSMDWTQYNGDTIVLTQQKTKKLIEVPCHQFLRDILDEERKRRPFGTIVANYRGRPVDYARFNANFRTLREEANLEDLQARDLRRTAMVNMAEAGCTEIEIAAVSGHSIESTRQILETYVPRNVNMARSAITKLEDHKKRESDV